MSSPEVILRDIEKQASHRWLPIIGQEKAEIISGIVDELRPSKALEVGTNIGYSAIVIASHMSPGSHLTTIEINPGVAREAKENIRRAGLADRVGVLVGDAIDIIPHVDGPIDFAFVDAEKDEYGRYLVLMEPKLHTGSVIVADNVGVYPRPMADFLNHVRHSGIYESRYLSVGWDGVEVSRRLR